MDRRRATVTLVRKDSRALPGRPAPEAPTPAFFVGFLGGILIAVEGLFVLAGGIEPFSLGVAVTPAETAELGGIGLTCGIAIVAVAFGLQEVRTHRVVAGVALLGLGALSLVCGGGFGLGLAGTIGAGLFALLRPPAPL